MTRRTERRLRQLIENPPDDGAIAEAKQFGVDLYGILENLKLTPAERFPTRCRRNRLCSPHPGKQWEGKFVSGVEQVVKAVNAMLPIH